MLSYLFFLILVTPIAAIFEDQVGKFDWRNRYVGCPHQVHYQRSKPTQSDLIYVSSEANVIAAIKPTTGDIAWRQLLEESAKEAPKFILQKKSVVSLARDGEVVRAWERERGLFAWETRLPGSEKAVSLVASGDAAVAVLGGSALYFIALSGGTLKWTAPLDNTKVWLGVTSGQRFAAVVGGTEGNEVTVVKVDVTSGKEEGKHSLPATWFSKEKCVLTGTSLVCLGTQSVYVLDALSDVPAAQEVLLPGVVDILSLKVDGFIGLSTRSNTYIYELKPKSPEQVLQLPKVDAVSMAVSTDDRKFVASVSTKDGAKIVGIDGLTEGKRVFSGQIKDSARSSIKDLSLAIAGREFELVIVGDDCRVDLYVSSDTELLTEWTRHEALSAIAAIEMIDLPLSEAQAGIESEFTADGANVLQSFIRRIMTQIDQIRRAVISAGKEIFSTSSLLNLRSKSVADWMSSLRYSAVGKSTRSSEMPLERDYFNLRKIIVATTLKSVVYGLDSNDGSVIWSLYLGSNVGPFKTSLNVTTVPLFIQRTTANFQFAPQAAVVFTDKITMNGIVVSFNPVNGAFLERNDLRTPIKRVELLPFADANSLHHLLALDPSEKVRIIPDLAAEKVLPLPVHLFSLSGTGHLQGYLVDTVRTKLMPQWRSTLSLSPTQKVVAIVGKPFSQRVHSSGRVLGDRSVLYKYSNPNLVAVAVFDWEHASLQIHLIDAVTGYIVYSAKQNKVSEPFHFIHCENWLTYSYWNEKARRTEIAVIELYEGLQQTDELQFNSFTPAVPPVVNAVTQAYIFPQGISAMGVTETEQGLSTRSVLLAMPFGGLYGISKRMLDARRPLEMTPELAEEMVIPYRPELPIVSEDFVNYNQSVYNIRGIKAAPAGLESTSLVLAYGLDIFFSRMTPSGTFDILKDDFDHALISLVLVGLILGSFICKKLGRSHTLKQAWQ